jgi:hypothetical protein
MPAEELLPQVLDPNLQTAPARRALLNEEHWGSHDLGASFHRPNIHLWRLSYEEERFCQLHMVCGAKILQEVTVSVN